MPIELSPTPKSQPVQQTQETALPDPQKTAIVAFAIFATIASLFFSWNRT